MIVQRYRCRKRDCCDITRAGDHNRFRLATFDEPAHGAHIQRVFADPEQARL